MATKDLAPESVKELQNIYGDGKAIKDNAISNVFYESLDSATGLQKQAVSVLRAHFGGGYYSFSDGHIKTFEERMNLIHEKKIENEEDIGVLRNHLYNPDDFQTSLVMGDLLDNKDNADEAKQAFDKVFLNKDANSLVQLYFTDDGDIFSGVVVAAERKDGNHAVYLIYAID